MRWWAAMMTGSCDVSRTPLRRVAAGDLSATSESKVASADAAVRRTSIGCAEAIDFMMS